MVLEIDYTARVLENQGVPVRFKVLDEDGEPVYDSDGEPKIEIRHIKMTSRIMMRIEQAFSGYTVKVQEPEMKVSHVLDLDPEDGKEYVTPKTVPTGHMALREQVFYGAAALEAMSEREPATAVVKALAIMLGESETWVADRMFYAEQEIYMASMSICIQVAQGVDPTKAAMLLEGSIVALNHARDAADLGVEIQAREQDALVETIEEAVAMMTKIKAEEVGIPGSDGSESGPANSDDPTKNSST